jgi:putative transposase
MPRPLRIIEPGLFHHVSNRAANRRALFVDDGDRETFVDLLEQCARRWSVRTVAAALLPGRYHLLVRDDHGELSRAMRHLDGVYTQTYNRRHGREGALLRGRFRDRVVQPRRYVLEVVRWIHQQPVRTGLVEHAADWPWCSHGAYVAGVAPAWLHTGDVWPLFGEDTPPDRERLDSFVRERAPAGIRRQLSESCWSPLLGSDSFVEEWRRRVRGDPRYDSMESAAVKKVRARSIDEVVAAGCDLFSLPEPVLLTGVRGRENLPRTLTLLACRELTAATLSETAARFGVSAGAVASLATRARRRTRDDEDAAERYRALLMHLDTRSARQPRYDPTGIRRFIDTIEGSGE